MKNFLIIALALIFALIVVVIPKFIAFILVAVFVWFVFKRGRTGINFIDAKLAQSGPSVTRSGVNYSPDY